jgi:S-formylglutathione hydrolase FrmB
VRMALAAALAGAALVPASAHAAELVKTERLGPRLQELTLRTPALKADTHVRVLLPTGYDPQRRYPVLYLLHGGADDYRSWTRPQDGKGDAEAITAGLPLIVVMPDAGQGGWYTDWYNNGAGGPPKWETFHIGELIPFIDAHYPTIARRGGRAIAGLSMGGFGAMSYASRHPDLFAAASTWSGAVDTNQVFAPHVLDAIAGLDGGQPGSLWGLRETQEVRWRAHNPWDLAANLRGMTLAIHTGNGETGGPYGGGGDPLEPAVHQMSVSFHERLAALGIEHVWDDYGPGGHDWPYWNRDLREDLPGIMAAFAKVRPTTPSRFSFTAVEPDYDIYGWGVALERPQLEFSTLTGAGADGFTLSGSGRATVTTPARYRARAPYLTSAGAVRADDHGRLHIGVDLGAANQVQEYSVPGSTAGTTFFTKRVTITRGGPCTSRRVVVVTLPKRAMRVVVMVNGRRREVLRDVHRRVRVSLAGLPRGIARVELRVRGRAVVRRRLILCGRA